MERARIWRASWIVLQRKVGLLPVREQLDCEQDAVQLHPKRENNNNLAL